MCVKARCRGLLRGPGEGEKTSTKRNSQKYIQAMAMAIDFQCERMLLFTFQHFNLKNVFNF